MVELKTGVIIACMPSMLLVAKWFRGKSTEAKRARAPAGPRGGLGGTFGSGGRAKKHNHSETTTSELHTHHLGSEEHIMRDLGGIVKSTEMAVVEMGMPPGSRGEDGSSELVC